MTTVAKPIISLRNLARRAPELEEEVLVTHQSQVIGTFTPAPRAGQDVGERGATAALPGEQGHGHGRAPALPGRLGAPETAAGAPTARQRQKARDEVLRKVARGRRGAND